MGLRVEGVVQGTALAGATAPFTDTFTYTISDGCGGTSAPATVSIDVTEPGSSAARLAAAQNPAKILIVNNSSAEITVYVGGAEIDVVQPRGTTVAPRSVASGANQQIRVEALSANPQTNGSTSTNASLDPDGTYTITYNNTGDGNPTISVAD